MRTDVVIVDSPALTRRTSRPSGPRMLLVAAARVLSLFVVVLLPLAATAFVADWADGLMALSAGLVAAAVAAGFIWLTARCGLPPAGSRPVMELAAAAFAVALLSAGGGLLPLSPFFGAAMISGAVLLLLRPTAGQCACDGAGVLFRVRSALQHHLDGWAGVAGWLLSLPFAWGYGAWWLAVAGPVVCALVPPVSRVVRLPFAPLKLWSPRGLLGNERWKASDLLDRPRRRAVFYTWVEYDKPDGSGQAGKDRPVVVIGRSAGRVFCLALTSKDHTYRDDCVSVGVGGWDSQRRESFVKADRVFLLPVSQLRRHAGVMTVAQFRIVMAAFRSVHGAGELSRLCATHTLVERTYRLSVSSTLLAGRSVFLLLLILTASSL